MSTRLLARSRGIQQRFLVSACFPYSLQLSEATACKKHDDGRIFTKAAGLDNMSVAKHSKGTNSVLLVSHFSSQAIGAESNEKDAISQEILMFEKWMAKLHIVCKSPEEREYEFKQFKEQGELANACSKVDPQERDLEIKKLFEKWMVEHNRVYDSPEEKKKRFKIFKKSVLEADAHNKTGSMNEEGINEFSDLTEKEFLANYTGRLPEWRKRSKTRTK